MPIYEYECQKCGHTFEVRQSFSDDPITRCETCKGSVRKMFSPPAIIFKGSGFYCNDNRSGKGKCSTCPSAEKREETGTCTPDSKCAPDSKNKCAAS
jgi:putative FmdB family regulatory protein